MDPANLRELEKLLFKRPKVFIRRDASGQKKIKINTGPFGLLAKHFVVDEQTMEKLRLKYGLNRD